MASLGRSGCYGDLIEWRGGLSREVRFLIRVERYVASLGRSGCCLGPGRVGRSGFHGDLVESQYIGRWHHAN